MARIRYTKPDNRQSLQTEVTADSRSRSTTLATTTSTGEQSTTAIGGTVSVQPTVQGAYANSFLGVVSRSGSDSIAVPPQVVDASPHASRESTPDIPLIQERKNARSSSLSSVPSDLDTRGRKHQRSVSSYAPSNSAESEDEDVAEDSPQRLSRIVKFKCLPRLMTQLEQARSDAGYGSPSQYTIDQPRPATGPIHAHANTQPVDGGTHHRIHEAEPRHSRLESTADGRPDQTIDHQMTHSADQSIPRPDIATSINAELLDCLNNLTSAVYDIRRGMAFMTSQIECLAGQTNHGKDGRDRARALLEDMSGKLASMPTRNEHHYDMARLEAKIDNSRAENAELRAALAHVTKRMSPSPYQSTTTPQSVLLTAKAECGIGDSSQSAVPAGRLDSDPAMEDISGPGIFIPTAPDGQQKLSCDAPAPQLEQLFLSYQDTSARLDNAVNVIRQISTRQNTFLESQGSKGVQLQNAVLGLGERIDLLDRKHAMNHKEIMMNLAAPASDYAQYRLPKDGWNRKPSRPKAAKTVPGHALQAVDGEKPCQCDTMKVMEKLESLTKLYNDKTNHEVVRPALNDSLPPLMERIFLELREKLRADLAPRHPKHHSNPQTQLPIAQSTCDAIVEAVDRIGHIVAGYDHHFVVMRSHLAKTHGGHNIPSTSLTLPIVETTNRSAKAHNIGLEDIHDMLANSFHRLESDTRLMLGKQQGNENQLHHIRQMLQHEYTKGEQLSDLIFQLAEDVRSIVGTIPLQMEALEIQRRSGTAQTEMNNALGNMSRQVQTFQQSAELSMQHQSKQVSEIQCLQRSYHKDQMNMTTAAVDMINGMQHLLRGFRDESGATYGFSMQFDKLESLHGQNHDESRVAMEVLSKQVDDVKGLQRQGQDECKSLLENLVKQSGGANELHTQARSEMRAMLADLIEQVKGALEKPSGDLGEVQTAHERLQSALDNRFKEVLTVGTESQNMLKCLSERAHGMQEGQKLDKDKCHASINDGSKQVVDVGTESRDILIHLSGQVDALKEILKQGKDESSLILTKLNEQAGDIHRMVHGHDHEKYQAILDRLSKQMTDLSNLEQQGHSDTKLALVELQKQAAETRTLVQGFRYDNFKEQIAETQNILQEIRLDNEAFFNVLNGQADEVYALQRSTFQEVQQGFAQPALVGNSDRVRKGFEGQERRAIDQRDSLNAVHHKLNAIASVQMRVMEWLDGQGEHAPGAAAAPLKVQDTVQAEQPYTSEQAKAEQREPEQERLECAKTPGSKELGGPPNPDTMKSFEYMDESGSHHADDGAVEGVNVLIEEPVVWHRESSQHVPDSDIVRRMQENKKRKEELRRSHAVSETCNPSVPDHVYESAIQKKSHGFEGTATVDVEVESSKQRNASDDVPVDARGDEKLRRKSKKRKRGDETEGSILPNETIPTELDTSLLKLLGSDEAKRIKKHLKRKHEKKFGESKKTLTVGQEFKNEDNICEEEHERKKSKIESNKHKAEFCSLDSRQLNLAGPSSSNFETAGDGPEKKRKKKHRRNNNPGLMV
ncbi:hypothetical protein C1H76_3419 [Elsinoe australis]|uniref:Uncharacterized protein n=1 Tax=Elsinoe australis TaxID=40998 RepID=A0A4U7B3P6_9PEZI|nr:hypothetical protein C1H76_3419 [Elsinoe australis]